MYVNRRGRRNTLSNCPTSAYMYTHFETTDYDSANHLFFPPPFTAHHTCLFYLSTVSHHESWENAVVITILVV